MHIAHKRKQEMQGGQNGLAVKLSLKEMKEMARALPLEAAASVHWAKGMGARHGGHGSVVPFTLQQRA